VASLPDYQPVFPCWPRKPLRRPTPTFGDDALDLLASMLEYDPHKRLRVRARPKHHTRTAHPPTFHPTRRCQPTETCVCARMPLSLPCAQDCGCAHISFSHLPTRALAFGTHGRCRITHLHARSSRARGAPLRPPLPSRSATPCLWRLCAARCHGLTAPISILRRSSWRLI
jgi:hypothetical protein